MPEMVEAAARVGRPIVYVHVGAPKTGTTYIQGILWQNRAALLSEGVLYPVPPAYAAHFLPAQDLLDTRFQGFADPQVPGSWDRVVEQARKWNDRVVVSHELLSLAAPKHVERAMETFGFAEVHVIFTARDLVRQIPAAWQEDLKNRGTIGFDDFVQALQDPEHGRHSPGTRSFWRMQDATDVLGRWGQHLPPERVHVVTVPHQAAPGDGLWERFAGLVGLDAERYDTEVSGTNPSLGVAEANLLRRINVALDGRVGWPVYHRLVKNYLAQKVLAARSDQTRIELPPEESSWAAKASQEIVDGLRAAGYHVVGDLDELLPAPPHAADERPRHPEDATDPEMLDAAVDAIAGLVARAGKPGPPPGAAAQNAIQRSAIKRAVWELSERHASMMRLRDLYAKRKARTARRGP